MPKHKRKHSEAAKEHGRLLEEARRRSRAIDGFVDLIPARFYLASDNPQVLAAKAGLDPGKIRATSRVVADAAAALLAGEASDEPKAMTKAAKRRLQRRGGAGKGSVHEPVVTSTANSREELHAKLERRIAELKEERRRRQQAKDKARAGAAAPAAAASGKPSGGAEVGRVAFDGREGATPFEAGVGRRGDKIRRMRAELRKAESDASKLRRAEDEGRGDEVRRDLALQKALKRARGEKVHDDTGKLRKAQRTLEAKRVKGKEKWDQRKDEIKTAMEDKQKKRKENLAKRVSQKKAKKQMRSGFEGERGDSFLNSEK